MAATWISKTLVQSGVVDHVVCGRFIATQTGQSQMVLIHAGSSLEMLALAASGAAASICLQSLQPGDGVLDMRVLRGGSDTISGAHVQPGLEDPDSLLLLSEAGRLTLLRYHEDCNRFLVRQEVALSGPGTQPRFTPRLLAVSPSGRRGVAAAAFQDRIFYLPPAPAADSLVGGGIGGRDSDGAPLADSPLLYRHQTAQGDTLPPARLSAGPVPGAAPRDLRRATADALAASDPRVAVGSRYMSLGIEPGCGAIWDVAVLEAPCLEDGVHAGGQPDDSGGGSGGQQADEGQQKEQRPAGREGGAGAGGGSAGGFRIAALVHRSTTGCGEVLLLHWSRPHRCLLCSLVVRLARGPGAGPGAAGGSEDDAGPGAASPADRWSLLGTPHMLRATPPGDQAAGLMVLGTHGALFMSAPLLSRHSHSPESGVGPGGGGAGPSEGLIPNRSPSGAAAAAACGALAPTVSDVADISVDTDLEEEPEEPEAPEVPEVPVTQEPESDDGGASMALPSWRDDWFGTSAAAPPPPALPPPPPPPVLRLSYLLGSALPGRFAGSVQQQSLPGRAPRRRGGGYGSSETIGAGARSGGGDGNYGHLLSLLNQGRGLDAAQIPHPPSAAGRGWAYLRFASSRFEAAEDFGLSHGTNDDREDLPYRRRAWRPSAAATAMDIDEFRPDGLLSGGCGGVDGPSDGAGGRGGLPSGGCGGAGPSDGAGGVDGGSGEGEDGGPGGPSGGRSRLPRRGDRNLYDDLRQEVDRMASMLQLYRTAADRGGGGASSGGGSGGGGGAARPLLRGWIPSSLAGAREDAPGRLLEVRWDPMADVKELLVPLLTEYDIHGGRPLKPIKQVPPVLGVERLPAAEAQQEGHVLTAADWLPSSTTAAATITDTTAVPARAAAGGQVAQPSQGPLAGSSSGHAPAAPGAAAPTAIPAAAVAAARRLLVCSAAGPALCLTITVTEAKAPAASGPSAVAAGQPGGAYPGGVAGGSQGGADADAGQGVGSDDLGVVHLGALACLMPGGAAAGGRGTVVRSARAMAALPPGSGGMLVWSEEGGDVLVLRHRQQQQQQPQQRQQQRRRPPMAQWSQARPGSAPARPSGAGGGADGSAAGASSAAAGPSGAAGAGSCWQPPGPAGGGAARRPRSWQPAAAGAGGVKWPAQALGSSGAHVGPSHIAADAAAASAERAGRGRRAAAGAGGGGGGDDSRQMLPRATERAAPAAASSLPAASAALTDGNISPPPPPQRLAPQAQAPLPAPSTVLALRLLGRVPQPRPMVDFVVSEAAAVSGRGRLLQVTGAVMGLPEISASPDASTHHLKLQLLRGCVATPVVARVPSPGATPTGMWSIPLRQPCNFASSPASAALAAAAAGTAAAAAAAAATAAAAAATGLSVAAAPAGGSLIVMSFLSASRALAPVLDSDGAAEPGSAIASNGFGASGPSLRDVTDALQLRHWEPTVAAGLVAEGVLVQITPSGILLASLDLLSNPGPGGVAPGAPAAAAASPAGAGAAGDDADGPPSAVWELPRSTWPSPKSSRFEERNPADQQQGQQADGSPPPRSAGQAMSMSVSVSVSYGDGASGGDAGGRAQLETAGSVDMLSLGGATAAAAKAAVDAGAGPAAAAVRPARTYAAGAAAGGGSGSRGPSASDCSSTGLMMDGGGSAAAASASAMQVDDEAQGAARSAAGTPAPQPLPPPAQGHHVGADDAVAQDAGAPQAGPAAAAAGPDPTSTSPCAGLGSGGDIGGGASAGGGGGGSASAEVEVSHGAAAWWGAAAPDIALGAVAPGCVALIRRHHRQITVLGVLQHNDTGGSGGGGASAGTAGAPLSPPSRRSRKRPRSGCMLRELGTTLPLEYEPSCCALRALPPPPPPPPPRQAVFRCSPSASSGRGTGGSLDGPSPDPLAPTTAATTSTSWGPSAGLPPLPPRAGSLAAAGSPATAAAGIGTGTGPTAVAAARAPWRYHLLIGDHAPSIQLLLLTHGSSGLCCTPLSRITTAVPQGLGPSAGPAGPQTPAVPESLVFIAQAPLPAAAAGASASPGSSLGGGTRKGAARLAWQGCSAEAAWTEGAGLAGLGGAAAAERAGSVLCLAGLRSGGLAAFSYGPPPPQAKRASATGDVGIAAEGGATVSSPGDGADAMDSDAVDSTHLPQPQPQPASRAAGGMSLGSALDDGYVTSPAAPAPRAPAATALRRLWHTQLEQVPLRLAPLGPGRPWQALAVGSAVHLVELAAPSGRLVCSALLPAAGSWAAAGSSGGGGGGRGAAGAAATQQQHPAAAPGYGLEALLAAPLFLPPVLPRPQPQQQPSGRNVGQLGSEPPGAAAGAAGGPLPPPSPPPGLGCPTELALVVLSDGSWRLMSLQRLSRLGRQPPSIAGLGPDGGGSGRRQTALPVPGTSPIGRPRLLLKVPPLPSRAAPAPATPLVTTAAATAFAQPAGSPSPFSPYPAPSQPLAKQPMGPSPDGAGADGTGACGSGSCGAAAGNVDTGGAGAGVGAAGGGTQGRGGEGYLVLFADEPLPRPRALDGFGWLHVLDAGSGRQLASFDFEAATGGFVATCGEVWQVGPEAGVGVAPKERRPAGALYGRVGAGGLGDGGGDGGRAGGEWEVAGGGDADGLMGRRPVFRGGVWRRRHRLWWGGLDPEQLAALGEVAAAMVAQDGADAAAGGGEGAVAPMDADGDAERAAPPPHADAAGAAAAAAEVGAREAGEGDGEARLLQDVEAVARRLRRLAEAADAALEGPGGGAAQPVIAAAGRPALGDAATLLAVGCSGHGGGEVMVLRLVPALLQLLPPPRGLPGQPQGAVAGGHGPVPAVEQLGEEWFTWPEPGSRPGQGPGPGPSAQASEAADGRLVCRGGDGVDGGGADAAGASQAMAAASSSAALPTTRVVQLQVILRLLLAKPVTAVCPYDASTLAVAAGRRLLFYRMRDGRLHRTGWHSTRNPVTSLAACPDRRLLACADGITGVVLYDVVHAESDAPGTPDGPPVALRLISADAVPRAVTSILLLPPAPQMPQPQQAADGRTTAGAGTAAASIAASGAARGAGSPPAEAMDVEAAEDPAAEAEGVAEADPADAVAAAAAPPAAAEAADSAPPVVAATDSSGRLLLLSPEPRTSSPCRNLCVLAEAQCPDAGLRLRAHLPAPVARYNAERPHQQSAPALLLAGLSGALHQVHPCPDAAAPLLALLERALAGHPAARPPTGGRHRAAREPEVEGADGAGRWWWWCHHCHPGVLDGDLLEQLLDLSPEVRLQVVRQVPREALRAALAAACSGRDTDFFEAVAAADSRMQAQAQAAMMQGGGCTATPAAEGPPAGCVQEGGAEGVDEGCCRAQGPGGQNGGEREEALLVRGAGAGAAQGGGKEGGYEDMLDSVLQVLQEVLTL